MTIDDDLLLRLTKLTKLQLNDEQRDQIKVDLDNILGMIKQLEAVDIEGIEPLVYLSQVENELRPDEVSNELSRTSVLKNAVEQDESGTFFQVPRVV